MKEKFFEEVKQNIYTLDDLNLFLEDIEKISDLVFKKPTLPLKEKLQENISEEFFGILSRFFETLPSSQKEFLKILAQLKDELLAMPLVKFQLAFFPTPRFIKKLSRWFEEKLKRRVVLDITVNPEIVGGIILEYQGKYLDLSLKKDLENLNLKNLL